MATFVVLTCCMVPIAAFDSAHMDSPTFACTALRIIRKAYVAPVRGLRHQAEIPMFSFGTTSLVSFLKALVAVELALAFPLLSGLPFCLSLVACALKLRRCLRCSQSQWSGEECLFEVRIFDDLGQCFSKVASPRLTSLNASRRSLCSYCNTNAQLGVLLKPVDYPKAP